MADKNFEQTKTILLILDKSIKEVLEKEVISKFEPTQENLIAVSLGLISVGLSFIPKSVDPESTLKTLDILIAKFLPTWKGSKSENVISLDNKKIMN